jgi:protein regulator of cytokinesis 1
VTELHEKLAQLWDRLHENYGHRYVFLAANRGHSADTLKALKDELKRCEELKHQNIKGFVEKIRICQYQASRRLKIYCDAPFPRVLKVDA